MISAKWWAAALTVALAASAGCSDVTFEGGSPVTISLSADRATASVGENVLFVYDARGSILDGVTVAYGDGVADTAYTSGALSARGEFLHAYGLSGSFTAVGVVYDAVQGSDTATVVIQVTEG